MSIEINYRNNPLHGVSLKKLLIEMVDHYGFEILFAYLSINCFKNNPSIQSSLKFLKKTDWAREKVEAFYLYQFNNLPKASAEQYLLSPRDRIVPEDQAPGEPAELSLEDAERVREKRAKKSSVRNQQKAHQSGKNIAEQRSKKANARDSECAWKSDTDSSNTKSNVDPWAKWKSKSKR